MSACTGGVDQYRLLVFGASGSIGNRVSSLAAERGWKVTGVSRLGQPASDQSDWIVFDPLSKAFDPWPMADNVRYDAVCWSQGTNIADSVYDWDAEANVALYQANCVFVAETMSILLKTGRLASPSRMCVVSSIWQEQARQNKLSYVMTKSAIGGFVRAASADVGRDGHLINAVLPGVLDTPMTRANLSNEQLENVQGSTFFGALPTLDAVAEAILFLCSDRNTGITGQSIAVDLGFSNVRII